MNKGIIVVLVLLLLVGAVIAGIVVTRKSKYTKGSVGAPLVVTNSCAANYACSKSVADGGCEDTPQCHNDIITSYPLPGSLQRSGGPPIKDCICSGYGKCEVSATGGANCTCNAGTNLDPDSDCSLCIGGYTWVGDASGKCVASPPIVCKNGGTPGPDGKSCSCPPGFTGNYCGCAGSPPGPGDDRKGWSCSEMVVCPYGEGTSISLDSCTHGSANFCSAGECGQGLEGCYITAGSTFVGPDCDFTSTSKTGTETHTIRQKPCVLEAGTITAKNNTSGVACTSSDGGCANPGVNYAIREGAEGESAAGQVYIGPKKVAGC